MSLFTPRYHYKPFEYPEVIKFTDLIAQTYWVVNELNFDSDVHDFHNLSNYDQHVITTCAKAISQVEVAVKKFGSSLDSVFPKPEISGVGSVWAESEFRHSEAYSKILDILGISDFYEFLKNPVIRSRFDSLKPTLVKDDPILCIKNISLFSLLVENTSLFSQFYIMRSYNRKYGVMKSISNVIDWSARDEQVHSQIGTWLILTLRNEFPNEDYSEYNQDMTQAAIDAFNVECQILDLIFDNKEPSHISRSEVEAFLQDRINRSYAPLGIPKVFDVDPEILSKSLWFYEEVTTTPQDDFFWSRPTAYTKKDISYSVNDLF